MAQNKQLTAKCINEDQFGIHLVLSADFTVKDSDTLVILGE
ncbi:MAG: hypothetical protein RBT11_18305 [Desulfobacterales bacterium]|jgi:hypothetical protein|nr:hypothetical protein [Desulfobacterales bacterium]